MFTPRKSSGLSGYGFSALEDPAAAVQEAVKTAGIADCTMAFIGCTISHNPEAVVAAFKEALPDYVNIHGVTSCGNILGKDGPNAGVGCLLIKAPGAFVSASGKTGAEAATALKCKLGGATPDAVIMGTTPGAEEGFIKEIEGVLGKDTTIWGGTAADNEVNGSWRVLTTEGAVSEGISLVGINKSKVKFGWSMLGPYTKTEKTAKVTAAEGRKITTLDDAPAADWVKEWLGDAVEKEYAEGGMILGQTAQKPIGIIQPNGSYIASHLAVLGGEDKSVTLFTPVATGDTLTVMDSGDGPSSGYSAALVKAYDGALKNGGIKKPMAGLLMYCGGMSIAVGDNLAKGLSDPGFQGKVKGMPMMGLTVFGEQFNMPGVGNCQNNLSMGMMIFE